MDQPHKIFGMKMVHFKTLHMNIGHDHLDQDPITLVINKEGPYHPALKVLPSLQKSLYLVVVYWSFRAVSGNMFVLLSAKAEHQIGCCASRIFARLTSW